MKKLFTTLFMLSSLISGLSNVYAQSSCVNADFSLGNFTDWTGSTYATSAGTGYSMVIGTPNTGPYYSSLTGKQTIMNVAGTDPNTGGALSVLPPGGTSSCRLGNAVCESCVSADYIKISRLEYKSAINYSNCLFTFQYAVVLQDSSGTAASDASKFTIEVVNSSGVQIGGACGQYVVTASGSLPSFNKCLPSSSACSPNDTVAWKDWTTVAIDLSPWIASEVTIQFTVYDATHGKDFGYAYISCSCGARRCTNLCSPTSVTLSAPAGFSSYQWNGGPATQDWTISPVPANGTVNSCVMTGTGGCQFTIYDTTKCFCDLKDTATVINATCDTCHNGSATGHAINGTPPYYYTWYTSPMQTTQTVTGLAPGTYTLCITDGHGCTVCDSTIYIDSTNCHGGISVSAHSDYASCSACNDGKAWVHASGGAPPYHYTWYTSPMQTTDTATGLMHGTYHVCVSDLYGCSTCDSVTVPIGNCSAHFNLYPDNTTPHHYYAVNLATGLLPISYSWTWGDGTHDTAAYPSHTYAAAGFYTICLSITDSGGCTNNYCDSFYLMKTTNTMITVNVIQDIITGINENAVENMFFMFPNPAMTNIYIEAPQNAIIEISNIQGQLIRTFTSTGYKTNVDISAFPNGIYIVEMKTEKGIAVRKFIKE